MWAREEVREKELKDGVRCGKNGKNGGVERTRSPGAEVSEVRKGDGGKGGVVPSGPPTLPQLNSSNGRLSRVLNRLKCESSSSFRRFHVLKSLANNLLQIKQNKKLKTNKNGIHVRFWTL